MELPCITSPKPEFDKKYKVVIRCKYDDDYIEKVNWVHKNSKDLVKIQVTGNSFEMTDIFFAFENQDDALVFKIKYSV
jgi:hypothetical protein